MVAVSEPGQGLVRRLLRAQRLSTAFVGRANGFGFLRLTFAVGVMINHCAAVGYTAELLPYVNLGHVGVTGFFGISGFLIARSALKSSLPRYFWHRFLRIMPGLWACLLVTGFVIAPLFWWRGRHTLDGLFGGPAGVFTYLSTNWRTGSGSYGIQNLFIDTPYGQKVQASVMNGSLWSLVYEMACYVGIALLAVTMLLKKARWLVLAGVAGVYAILFANLELGHQYLSGNTTLPYFGLLANSQMLWFGTTFLVGSAAALFAEYIPVNDVLAVLSLASLVVMQLTGHWLSAWYIPPFLYFIYWAAVRVPPLLHRVGQRSDYSYGVYIYAFPVQQSLASLGLYKSGLFLYTVVTVVVVFALAFASWHLVEKWALRAKDWTPSLGWLRRWSGALSRRRAVGRHTPAAQTARATAEPGPAPAVQTTDS